MAWKPDYVTTAELRKFATRSSETIDDDEIDFAISTASRAVDNHTYRQFGLVAAPEARYYTAHYDQELLCWVVDIDDLQTETGLEINLYLDDDDTFDDEITAYTMRPRNAAQKDRPWTQIAVKSSSANQPGCRPDSVEVTARFGWTDVPTAVKEATLLQGSRLLARRNAPFGIAGSPESGSEMRLLARLDPDVAVSLKDYIRWWAAA